MNTFEGFRWKVKKKVQHIGNIFCDFFWKVGRGGVVKLPEEKPGGAMRFREATSVWKFFWQNFPKTYFENFFPLDKEVPI